MSVHCTSSARRCARERARALGEQRSPWAWCVHGDVGVGTAMCEHTASIDRHGRGACMAMSAWARRCASARRASIAMGMVRAWRCRRRMAMSAVGLALRCVFPPFSSSSRIALAQVKSHSSVPSQATDEAPWLRWWHRSSSGRLLLTTAGPSGCRRCTPSLRCVNAAWRRADAPSKCTLPLGGVSYDPDVLGIHTRFHRPGSGSVRSL